MSLFGFKGTDPGTPLEKWLPALREAGFSWVEIRAPEAPDAEWEERLREWHRDGWAFAVHARFFGINLSSPNPRVRKAAVEVALEDLAFAGRIGAQRLNLHAGDVNWYDVPPPDHPAYGWMMEALNHLRERHLAAAAQSVAEIAQAAQRQGIEIVVENLYKPWDLLCTPQEVREFLAGADRWVGFTLDTGHARVAGWSPTAFLQNSTAGSVTSISTGTMGLLIPMIFQTLLSPIWRSSCERWRSAVPLRRSGGNRPGIRWRKWSASWGGPLRSAW
jgi:Sugar phosphate isomerases/epimerases